MALRALGCFEKVAEDHWVCQQDVTIDGASCTVAVKRGQLFRKGSAFAGYDDFTEYLTKMVAVLPDKLPHEWTAADELAGR
jgi:hypothetical protein